MNPNMMKVLNQMIEEMPKVKLDNQEFDELLFSQVIFDIPNIEPKIKTKTIARIFGRSKNENFLSDWLAYLFEHDTRVLSVLLNNIGIEDSIGEYNVSREYTLSDNRRIDFLIKSEEYLIGIENKIDSREQENQLKDYSKELIKLAKGKEVIKILLKPQSNTIKGSYGFKPVTYEAYIQGLKSIQLDFIEDLRGSFLLLDFIKHMEENIIMDRDKEFAFNEWTEYIYKYRDQIKNLQKATKIEEQNIVDYIVEKIISLVDDEQGWKFVAKRTENKFIQVFKNKWDKQPNVHFELFRTDNNVIPTKYVLRIDIEGKKETKDDKNMIRDQLKLKNFANEFGTYDIDYKDEKSFTNSVDLMINDLKELMDNYSDEIDNIFNLK